MKIRDVVLQDEYAVNDEGTWTFNVNLVDPVTEFKVWFRADASPQTTPDGPIERFIEEVALVDGSEVIAAMTGEQAIALYGFERGVLPHHVDEDVGGVTNLAAIPLTFGRTLEDPEWIFDPKRFRNPQLRITWADIAQLGPTGNPWFQAGTAAISVWAKVMEEGANPRGYLMAKELKEFETAAAGEEVTYLPTDYPLRKVLVRAHETDEAMETIITNLKLSIDEDRFVPWNLEADDFIALMHNWFDSISRDMKMSVDDAGVAEHMMGSETRVLATPALADNVIAITAVGDGMVTVSSLDLAGAAVDPGRFWLRARSRTPHACYAYPFGDQGKAEDWFQVRDVGNVRLILTQGNAGSTCQIVVQQAHPY